MLQVQPDCPEVVRYIMEWRSNATLTKFIEGDREPGVRRGAPESGLKALLTHARPFPASQASQSGGVLLRLSADIHQTKSETGRLTTDAPNLQVRCPSLRTCRITPRTGLGSSGSGCMLPPDAAIDCRNCMDTVGSRCLPPRVPRTDAEWQ